MLFPLECRVILSSIPALRRCFGSASHRLAKALASPLSAALSKKSCAHLRNSTDLKEKLQEVSSRAKKLVSCDVKSPFANVAVDGATDAVKKALEVISEDRLPLCQRDYMKFGAFWFNDEEYRHMMV